MQTKGLKIVHNIKFLQVSAVGRHFQGIQIIQITNIYQIPNTDR